MLFHQHPILSENLPVSIPTFGKREMGNPLKLKFFTYLEIKNPIQTIVCTIMNFVNLLSELLHY